MPHIIAIWKCGKCYSGNQKEAKQWITGANQLRHDGQGTIKTSIYWMFPKYFTYIFLFKPPNNPMR